MNFDFSDALKQLRGQAQAFLGDRAARAARDAIEGRPQQALWAEIARLGWLGAALPESVGGSGLGEEGLCVLAEALGARLVPVPFASSAYLAAQAILLFGSAQQKGELLPALADGSLTGCFALAEAAGAPSPDRVAACFAGGALTGQKQPVVDGLAADLAVVAARGEDGGIGLVVVRLDGVQRIALEGIDPSRPLARLGFAATPAEPLPGGQGWSAVERVLDRAAVFCAFEQLGGAQACLEMARDYALARTAFGRPIGSFQAIKHKLAEVYVAVELARSNATYAAWALASEAPDLPAAAAAARIACTRAFELAAAENIQTHGGMGFTWESDCHLFYRRAKHLALVIGAAPYWKNRLVSALELRNAV